MQPKIRSFLIRVAAYFPFVALFLWTVQLTFLVRTGTEVQFKVTAYDPRDLLAGHYLLYRIDYGMGQTCEAGKRENQCICLNPVDGSSKYAHGFWLGDCSEKPDCPIFLKGECGHRGFSAEIERFYAPEEISELTRIPENSSILVSIDASGRGLVKEFLVQGAPLIEYLRRKPPVELPVRVTP